MRLSLKEAWEGVCSGGFGAEQMMFEACRCRQLSRGGALHTPDVKVRRHGTGFESIVADSGSAMALQRVDTTARGPFLF